MNWAALNGYCDSSLKTPLHGVIKKTKTVSQEKEVRLFPELTESRDGYSRAFSKWFNRTYRKNINVGQLDSEQKAFHSLRHTFSNYYKQLGSIDEYRVAEIVGHKSASTSITYDRYGKSSSIKQKKALIEKLKFDFIEFDKFRIWK